MASIMFRDFDPKDYPQLLTAPYMPSNIAYVIFEQDVTQSVRLFPWIGAGLSPIPYFVHRGRLPFYDRSNLMYRHYLFHGIVAGFVAGLAIGVGSGLWTVTQRYGVNDEVVRRDFGGDRAAAEKDAEVRLVNDALVLRRNPRNVDWVTTTSKIMMLNAAMVLIVYSQRGRLYRGLLGAGSGAMIAGVVCATGLDTTLNNQQSAPAAPPAGLQR